jgi:hypothetical protein
VLIRTFRVQRNIFSAGALAVRQPPRKDEWQNQVRSSSPRSRIPHPAPHATAAGVICFVIHRHVSQASARRRREGHEASDQT